MEFQKANVLLVNLLLNTLPHYSIHPGSFIMEKVDLVMVGAEGVAESGGIINKVNGLCTASARVALVTKICTPYALYFRADWDLPDGCDGQGPQQAFLRCGREL